MLFRVEVLVDLVRRILVRHGMSEGNAAIIAAVCVAAERDGAENHGIFRIVSYVAALQSGWVDGQARPILDNKAAASIIGVDACNGFAQPALAVAKMLAIEKAKRTGCCLVAIRNSHHLSPLWPDVEMFAREGLVTLAFVNSIMHVVPPGGRVPVYGTNPMAFGVPRAEGEPLIFDQASSTMAFGEVRLAARAGKMLAPGVGVDRNGNPTTDPMAIIEGGALLPFGGYKGASIAMMVEILAAALTGGAFAFEVDYSQFSAAPTARTGELVILIDPQRAGRTDFTSRIEVLVKALRASGQARLPGDRRYLARQLAEERGIEIGADVLQELSHLLS
ncbi:MAG TPA: Ldh family oxidoreductase [Alphaproteobacteria bacterium]|nr:Ldh family oxidoreductase [Alphaproteobacteria bacterium]